VPRLLFVSLILGPMVLVGCQDIEHYGVPNLEGGVGTPGTGGGGSSDGGAMDGGSDGGAADAGSPDAGSYVPSCAITGGAASANQLDLGAGPIPGAYVFADYLTCPADYLAVVLTTEACSVNPSSGLFIDVAVADIDLSVTTGANVANLVSIAYFDGAGNVYCNQDVPAVGSLTFVDLGASAGDAVSTLAFLLSLEHCKGPAGGGSIDVSGAFDVLVGRDPADACGP